MKRITFVDDDPDIQEIFSLVFQKSDYDINVFSKGSFLLEKEYDIADLIILDKQLPDMDGLEVCRRLKQENKTKRIPIIMLSANRNIHQLAKEAGAEDSIEKPFSIKHLKKKVEKYL